MAAAPPLSALDAPDRIASKPLPPVVVFAGEEPFLAEEGIAAIVRKSFPAGEPAGALVELDAASPADENRIAAAMDELRTPSLFGDGKVVVIRRAEAIGKAGPGDAQNDEDDDAPTSESDAAPAAKSPAGKSPRKPSPITALVKEAAAAAVLGSVLVLSTSKPVRGKGSVSAEAIQKTGALLVDCRRLYDSTPPWARASSPFDTEVAKWISRRAKSRHQKSMDARTAHALSVRIGASLSELSQALETLAVFVGSRPAIVEGDVVETVGDSREEPAWALADAVIERDAPRAFSMASAAFDRGLSDAKGRVAVRPEAVYPMLSSALHASWRRTMRVAEALSRGEDPAGISSLAGLPGFVVERIMRQARTRDVRDLLSRHKAFVEADAGVRGGGVPPRLAFERMLVELLV